MGAIKKLQKELDQKDLLRQADISKPQWRWIKADNKDTEYMVSNTGEVVSTKFNMWRPLKQFYNSDKYRSVKLYTANGKKNARVHRLVAEAFIPNPANKPEVNHIDGNKDNNWVGNLEWCTNKENVDHAWKTGLTTVKIGEAVGNSICTEKQAREICKLLEQGKGAKEISQMLNIPKYICDNIKAKVSWTHVSKDYNIPDMKSHKNHDPETREKVYAMFRSGMFHYPTILDYLGLPNNQFNRSYLSKIKSDFKKLQVSGSTTIPKGSKT